MSLILLVIALAVLVFGSAPYSLVIACLIVLYLIPRAMKKDRRVML